MAVNALFITSVLLMALGLWLLEECRFLAPYRGLLFGPYLKPIALFTAALFVNVFAAVYLGLREAFLKDTGRKLAHLDKQLRTDAGLSEDLADLLREQP
jgi:hypothetical protein